MAVKDYTLRSVGQKFGGFNNVADWSPLVIDCGQAGPTTQGQGGPGPNEYWKIRRIIAKGILSQSPLPNMAVLGTGSPEVTLCMIPVGTPPETLAQGQGVVGGGSGIGINLDARGIPIATNANAIGTAGGQLPGNNGYPFTLIGAESDIFCPPMWIPRAIVLCNPGTAQPGPGANSFGSLIIIADVWSNQ